MKGTAPPPKLLLSASLKVYGYKTNGRKVMLASGKIKRKTKTFL